MLFVTLMYPVLSYSLFDLFHYAFVYRSDTIME